jgi:hypothetical protein
LTGDRKKTSIARRLLQLILIGGFLIFNWLSLAAAVRASNREAEIRIVARQAVELNAAFEKYYQRHREYPRAYTGRAFEVETLDPLFSRGYYRGVIASRLRDHRADAYDSPDDQGPNQEFWLEMTLAEDPSIRILLARSDDAPLGGGRWYEGAFLYRDGALEPL